MHRWKCKKDELLWAAAWLYIATGEKNYERFIADGGNGGVPPLFTWDYKYVGAQTLVAKASYKSQTIIVP